MEDERELPRNLEVDPAFFRAIVSKKLRDITIGGLNHGQYMAIIVDLNDFKIYVGVTHRELKGEFGTQNNNCISAYVGKIGDEFDVTDLRDIMTGTICDKDQTRANIARIIKRDVSFYLNSNTLQSEA